MNTFGEWLTHFKLILPFVIIGFGGMNDVGWWCWWLSDSELSLSEFEYTDDLSSILMICCKKLVVNNSYAIDCQSVFITTCCDHMSDESINDYPAYCDGSSLDSVIELFQNKERPGTYESIDISEYY